MPHPEEGEGWTHALVGEKISPRHSVDSQRLPACLPVRKHPPLKIHHRKSTIHTLGNPLLELELARAL